VLLEPVDEEGIGNFNDHASLSGFHGTDRSKPGFKSLSGDLSADPCQCFVPGRGTDGLSRHKDYPFPISTYPHTCPHTICGTFHPIQPFGTRDMDPLARCEHRSHQLWITLELLDL
jgi:hypothetical protein